MYKEDGLSQDLFRLERALIRTLLGSREFKNLRRKIVDMGLEMNVLLMVMAQDKHKKRASLKKKKWEFRLSSQDKEFLKTHGIGW